MTLPPPSILVVDDVEANLVAMQALLDGLDCDVVLARSGNEALRWLLKRKFLAMLLDVQMPHMDGYEVARHARNHPETRDVPIIFLTATHETENDALRGYGTGAVDYLFKPVSPVVLRSKIRVFMDLYESRRQVERAYADLQTTQAQLVQSAKMASLGELVAGVAHEVNNPLAFAKSHLKTARHVLEDLASTITPSLDDESREGWHKALNRLSEMNHGLERISELVQQLRNFSRLDEGQLKTITIRECIDSVLMILGHRMRDRIEVELDLRGPEAVECYPGPLNLALSNLVSNAIDAIEERGTIGISTTLADDTFSLSVRDDGAGIPEDIRERVFEPFFTTKPVGRGTGLGLSISYSVARKHGGDIQIHSVVGAGTTMTLQFPLSLRTE